MGGTYLRLLRQLSLILGIYFLGEFLQKLLHLPIPGSVVGMLILLLALYKGIIKLDMIESVSNFLLENLSFFFIPAGVGLMANFTILKNNLFGILAVTLLSTIIIMLLTGTIVQLLIRRSNK